MIHRAWLGGDEPEWMQALAAGWQQLPGWWVRGWGESDLPPLRNQHLFDLAPEIAPDHVGQLRSDILRYELILEHGGVWVDTDFELVRPFDDLLEGVECFAAWEVQDRWVNNAIFGAVPGHPFVEKLVELLPASIESQPGARPARMSGPQFVTKVWARHGEGVTVFDEEQFYPYSWREAGKHEPGEEWPEHVRAVHHWANKRREGKAVRL